MFIYDPERTTRVRKLFNVIDDKNLNIFVPAVFGIELASQLVRRKPKIIAQEVYDVIMSKVIVIEDIEYDLLFGIAFSTGCRAIDAFYIAASSIVPAILVTADRIMSNNARKYGIEAYYIHDETDFKTLISKII